MVAEVTEKTFLFFFCVCKCLHVCSKLLRVHCGKVSQGIPATASFQVGNPVPWSGPRTGGGVVGCSLLSSFPHWIH